MRNRVRSDAGPRICPGRYLAMLEVKLVLATIARGFKLIEVGANGSGEPRERIALTMSPEAVRLRVAARKQ